MIPGEVHSETSERPFANISRLRVRLHNRTWAYICFLVIAEDNVSLYCSDNYSSVSVRGDKDV